MATTYELAVKIAGKLDSTFGQSFMSAASTLQKHQEKIVSVKKGLKELEEAHKQGKISAEEYAASYAKLSQQLDKAKAAQERLAKATKFQHDMEQKVTAARSKLLRSTAAMGAALGPPIVRAMQFESAMADVRKVVDFETPEQFKQMSEDILGLARRIPMTAKGFAEIIAAAGQAGIARDELVSFAENAAKMAIAFDISAEEAGRTMAQWRVAFKMPQEEVVRLADQINYLSNNVNATAPQITEIVTRIGPLGQIAGVSAMDVAALGAAAKAAGIETEVVATGLKNFMLRLTAGSSATKKQKDAFKTLGLSATGLAKAMQKDARGAILSVIEALGKIPEYKRGAILTDIFGRESVAAISPFITNLDELRKNLELVSDETLYAGSMQHEFEVRSKTTANALQLLLNNVDTLAIHFGSILLPPVAEAANKLSEFARTVADWADKHPKLTKVLILGAAGFLALKVAIAAVEFVVFSVVAKLARLYVFLVRHNAATKIATISTKAFSLAQKGLRAVLSLSAGALHAMPIVAYRAKVVAVAAATKLWTGAQVASNLAMKLGTSLLSVTRLVAYTVAVKGIAIATKAWAAIQWLLNAALSANPIGLLVIAIAGLVAGFVLLYKKSETVRNVVSRLWDVIGIGPRIIAAVIGKVRDFVAVLGKIKLPDIFGSIRSGITDIAKTIAGKIGNVFSGITAPNIALMPKIVWDVAKFPFDAISAIPEKIMGIMGKIKLPDIWGPFESAAIGAFRAVKEKMSGLIAFLNDIAPIASLGKIYDALASGAANAYSFVMDKFSQLLSYLSAIKWPESLGKIWDILTSGAASAFSITKSTIGRISGIISGIKLPDIWGQSASMASQSVGFIKDKISDLLDAMGAIKIPNSLISMWDTLSSAVESSIGFIWDKTAWLFNALSNIQIPDFLGKIWDVLASGATQAYNFVTEKMASLISFLDTIIWPESLGHLWNILISSGASAYNFIVEKMDALISFLGGIIWPTSLGSLWDIITSGATSMFQTVINALNWVIDKVNWFIDKLNKIKLPSWLPMVGGKGVNIEMIEQIKAPAAAPAPVPGHAEGGIFSIPHVAMVAERGPEAIMPLDKLLAAMREGGAKAAAPSINITYSPASPVVNIYGQGEMNAEQIRSEVLRAERKAQEEFEARLKAFLAQQRRLNYA